MKISIDVSGVSDAYVLATKALKKEGRFLGMKLISALRWVKNNTEDFGEAFSSAVESRDTAYRNQVEDLRKQYADKDENGKPKTIASKKTVLDNKGNTVEQDVTEYVLTDKNRSLLQSALFDFDKEYLAQGEKLRAQGKTKIVLDFPGIDPKIIPYFDADLSNAETKMKFDADPNKFNDAESAAFAPFIIGSAETVSDDMIPTKIEDIFSPVAVEDVE